MYGLYSKKITKAACYVNFAWGSLLMVITTVFKTQLGLADSWFWSSPINTGVLAMVGGLVIVPLVSLITRKPDEAEVEEIFSCYNKTVKVPVTEALSISDDEEED